MATGFNFGKAFRSIWHSLISDDRHSDFDSPYRTGQHVPLAQGRHDPLTSVATHASESRADLSSPLYEDGDRGSMSALNGTGYSNSPLTQSPALNSPYSPGMRSSATLHRQSTLESLDNSGPGEIQLQAFHEGLPPPPPPSHTWKRIDKWAEEHYEELFDALGEGCTNNDLNELEHHLDCSLPMEVRESLQVHDGQEQGGRPTGIIFGCMLLDCEEIVHEWQNWKVVNQEYLTEPVTFKPATPSKALGGASSASSSKHSQKHASNPHWRQELLARQDCVPPNSIQKVYAHPAWIPLARDWGGNNLAVDLTPGPGGKWGQVILFGRDYDTKYVVARSWSALLATVADDLNSGKWFVDDETNELKLREFRTSHVEPGYLDILRWRVDQKYGRKPPPRRRPTGKGVAPPNASASPAGSPYASPAADINPESRGRSMQRFSESSPVSSPNKPNYGKSSPLPKVSEEAAPAITIHTNGVTSQSSKLVEVSTPRGSDEQKRAKDLSTMMEPVSLDDENKENAKIIGKGLGLINSKEEKQASVEEDNGMKTIEI